MSERFFNIYVIFSIVMIIALLIHFESPVIREYDTMDTILQEMDFTGYTRIFRDTLLIINIGILLVCLLLGIIIDGRGVICNYNKILVILFILLSILPFALYIFTIEEENKHVQELLKESDLILEGKFDLNNKKHVSILNKHSSNLETDQFFKRKSQIASQLRNNQRSTVLNALENFFFYPIEQYLNENHIPRNEDSYYAVFPGYTYINIICVMFYYITSKVKDTIKAENKENLEIGEVK